MASSFCLAREGRQNRRWVWRNLFLAANGNVVDKSCSTYGTAGTGGSGDLNNYNKEVNNPNLRFTSYSDDAKGRGRELSTYTENTNTANSQKFISYGKTEMGNEYKNYGMGSNVVGSNVAMWVTVLSKPTPRIQILPTLIKFNNYEESFNNGSRSGTY
ncbi:hypothetical protein SLEP1_g21669 [Rubroshorea leprosula]|uniref:Uncharacterized protein n=1 Tax=Rubroshorea leprosula TaxID=152421 RepID=A0AAV5JFZ7_9ROSI|nr:hypothetical protein SLEP1_g21669 [Rubroshorea leprosula]